MCCLSRSIGLCLCRAVGGRRRQVGTCPLNRTCPNPSAPAPSHPCCRPTAPTCCCKTRWRPPSLSTPPPWAPSALLRRGPTSSRLCSATSRLQTLSWSCRLVSGCIQTGCPTAGLYMGEKRLGSHGHHHTVMVNKAGRRRASLLLPRKAGCKRPSISCDHSSTCLPPRRHLFRALQTRAAPACRPLH